MASRGNRYRTATGIVVSLLVIGGLSTVAPANAVQADEWPDSCSDAPVIDAMNSTVLNGTINSPDDDDTFLLNISKGEHVAVTMNVPSAEGEFTGRFFSSSIRPESGDVEVIGDLVHSTDDSEGLTNASAIAFMEESDEHMCIRLSDREPDDARLPYDWEVRLKKNTRPPVPVDSEIQRLEDENAQLRSVLDEKNETIAQLRNETNATTADG